MSLDAVIKRILDRGRSEADAVIDAAKKDMEKSLQLARENGQQDISHMIAEARRAAEKLRLQESARAELEARKVVLGSQKEVLDSVRAEVLGRLADRGTKAAILQTLLDIHRADWRSGKVFCNAEDRDSVKDVVGSKFGGTIGCAGGIVIESDDGTIRIDLRFETILQDIWEDSVKELADILWPTR
jgi:V/A-type H+-transporting ATPase subunit E